MPEDANLDETAIREQLKQTQLAYQMATEMSQFKSGFLARTAHELRSPLSSMIGLHQLILADLCEDPAEEREFVTQAHASAMKLVKLLDEIIAVAKTAHGTNQLDIQPVHLVEVFEEVHGLIHLPAANRSLRLQVAPPDPEIYVLADPKRLRQVLVNLADIAIAYMKEGNIHFSAQLAPASQYVCIWIDAQCPVEAWTEPVDLLRSPAKQDEQAPEIQGLSPGMNLFIDQMLMEAMQGRLEVVSAENISGVETSTPLTRLQLTLPLVEESFGQNDSTPETA